MKTFFENPIVRKNSVLRKGGAFALKPFSSVQRRLTSASAYKENPPIIVNSVPKSGTHLLLQVTQSMPRNVYRGNFIATNPSTTLKERTSNKLAKMVYAVLPNETLGAHIYHSPEVQEALKKINAVHLFIYRDPRDVVTSEAFYLAEMNKWHRMHKPFSRLETPSERLSLALKGLDERYPECNARLLPYAAWLECPNTIAIKYEDIAGEHQGREITRIVDGWLAKGGHIEDRTSLIKSLQEAVQPKKSHTFRRGGTGKWRESLDDTQVKDVTNTLAPSLKAFGYI